MAKQDTQKTVVKKTGTKVRKKIQRNVPSGIVHVKATFNNTIIAITDLSGNVISWASAGKVNFSGSRKSSAFAATVAAQDAAKVAMSAGMKEVEVNLKGPGAGRESAVRGLQSSGLMITIIRDKTPVPHNGCRARKRRRV
ncbi:MAG: 30S ribosomal protein S11 [Chlamydiota bacterium]